ncbi:hypothetical protein O181_025263 [Austropuccinia psidii MF-1]|uniref:Uncharacterized protein n=1 Tax=Austropuccinia psidii MF-1 TaxID=1389203 RepID=A0A9Q3CME4_9BASI|nr:hypothetical protein [Austropuccinia psidii MF-1]
MAVVYKEEDIHNNYDSLSRWELANTHYNPPYLYLEADSQILIEGINITDIETEVFEEVRYSFKQGRNYHISASLLDKDCKFSALVNSLFDKRKS